MDTNKMAWCEDFPGTEREFMFAHWETVVDGLPREALPEVWNRINRFEWDTRLGEMPNGWENMSLLERHQATKDICSCIESRSSSKELLRYHHKVELGRTDQQFEDWWDSMVLSDLREEMRNHSERHSDSCPWRIISAISIAAAVLSLAAIAMQLC